MNISKAERADLKRIVKSRIELIKEQISHRTLEVKNAIKDDIRSDYQDAIKQARDEVNDILERGKALESEADALIDSWRERGVDIVYQSYAKPITVDSRNREIKVYNENEEIQRRINELREKTGFAKINLRELELELLEELTIDSLDSEDAKKFLGKIPTIDSLLPKAEEAVQLTA